MIRGTTVLGVGSSEGPLLENREKGRTPVNFGTVKKNPRYYPLSKLAPPPWVLLP